jgi:hypothetical protein
VCIEIKDAPFKDAKPSGANGFVKRLFSLLIFNKIVGLLEVANQIIGIFGSAYDFRPLAGGADVNQQTILLEQLADDFKGMNHARWIHSSQGPG